MKKLLFVFPLVALLAVGCSSSNTATPIKANITIKNLQASFKQHGYSMGADAGSYNFWWLDANGIAINLPKNNSVSFNFKNSFPNYYDAQTIANSSEAKQIIQSTDSYLITNGFSVQTNQSTGIKNPNTDQEYTRAYFNPQTSIRCRLFIRTLEEVPPYTYTDTTACSDRSDYDQAYNAQAPYLKNSQDGTYSTDYLYVVNTSYKGTCKNDPTLKIISFDAANGTSAGSIKGLKLVNGVWVDSKLSPYQITALCK